MKPLITIGCKTDHGGIVAETDPSFQIEGKPVHLEGMKHFCPKCKKVVSAVSLGKSFLVVGSKTIIMAGDKTTCGATFLPQQSLVVRDAGSGSGKGSSTSSSSPIFETSPQNEMMESFSKTPKKPLTEEEKILTQEECKMILLHVWGNLIIDSNKLNSFSKLSLTDRKYITEHIYFRSVNKDESLSVITSIMGSFGNLTSKAAVAVIERAIVTDIAKMEAESAVGKWWNNEVRQKYFKVGWSENPVDRFKDVNTAILISLKRDERSHITNMLSIVDSGF